MLGCMAPGPGPSAVAGILSHAALDAIPHSDYGLTAQGVLDVAATCLVAALVSLVGWGPWALSGGVAAALPDLEVAVGHLFPRAYRPPGRLRLIFPTHSGLVRHGRLRWPWGGLTQVAVVGLGAMALWAFASVRG